MLINISEKIKKANKLKIEIDQIRDFISLAKSAQTIDIQNAKSNELGGVNKFTGCNISAYISTGTQSPEYRSRLESNETIMILFQHGLAGLEKNLTDKEKELKKLFTNN